jgi:hypothetical protein
MLLVLLYNAILNSGFFSDLFLAWGLFEGILEWIFFGQIWNCLKATLSYEIELNGGSI